MAIAVASVSSMVYSNYPTDTVTLTAPTGITTGDLLVIIAGGEAFGTPIGGSLENYSANSGIASCTGFTEGYFHSRDVNANSGVGGAARVNVLYKIAEASDEAASTYSVTHSAGYGGAAIMFRITGWSTGNPFAHGRTAYTSLDNDGSTTLSWSGTVVRPSQHVLLMYAVTSGVPGSYSYSAYASTPSETWTEAGDTTFRITNYDDGAMAVAYATSSSTSDLTAFELFKTGDSFDTSEMTIFGVLPIFTPVNASGTTALLSADADFFTNAGTSDGAGTTARHDASPTFFGANGEVTQATEWSTSIKS